MTTGRRSRSRDIDRPKARENPWSPVLLADALELGLQRSDQCLFPVPKLFSTGECRDPPAIRILAFKKSRGVVGSVAVPEDQPDAILAEEVEYDLVAREFLWLERLHGTGIEERRRVPL